jgi:hypothetical protein
MDEFLKKIASEDRELRLEAILNVLYDENVKIVPVLKDLLLTEKDLHVISAAVKVIGLLAADDELELIGTYLCHRDPRVRANAVEALGGCNSAGASSLAAAMMGDENHRVRLNAALMLVDDAPALIENLMDELWNSGNEDAQSGVLWAACNLSAGSRSIWAARGLKHSSEAVRDMARLLSEDMDDDSDDGSGIKKLVSSAVRKIKKKRKLYIHLSGRIVEGVKKDPVKGVTIRLANTGIQEQSDRHGRFCFDRLEANKVHIFVCEKIAWPTTTFRLRVSGQRDQRTIIRMRSQGISAKK